MASATNIKRRGSVYYVRVAVPKDVQGVLKGKKDIWKSLRVNELKTAKRLAPRVLSELYQMFDEARQRREPDDETIRLAVWDFYQREVGLDEAERSARRRPGRRGHERVVSFRRTGNAKRASSHRRNATGRVGG